MKRLAKLCALAGLLLLPGNAAGRVAERLNVVATLSTFGDLVKAIGGDHVDVTSIASPTFNPHFIEPKPSDVLKVKRATLFVHAGLDLELWRGPLLDAAGNTRLFPGSPGDLDLSRGINLLEVPTRPMSRMEGDIHIFGNPHYWLNPENVHTMAQAICDKLCALDPQHEQDYRHNLQEFLATLNQKIPEWRARLAPYQSRELVAYHNTWPYLMRFAGLKMEQFLEPKPGIPPSPRQVEFITQHVRQTQIPAIVQESFFPTQTANTIAKRTGAKVVLLCQNVREAPECSDYVAMIDYNLNQLIEALR